MSGDDDATEISRGDFRAHLPDSLVILSILAHRDVKAMGKRLHRLLSSRRLARIDSRDI